MSAFCTLDTPRRRDGRYADVRCPRMLTLNALLACAPGAISLDGSATGTDPVPVVTVAAAPAFDPFAGGVWTFTVAGSAAETHVVDAAGATVRASVLGSWDGKNDVGAWVGTGNYRLVVGDGEATGEVAVVRPGLVAAFGEDDAGATGVREPLYWHRAQVLQDVTVAFSQVATIDDENGVRTSLPAVTDQLEAPEANRAEPLAYRFDSRPIVAVQFGGTSSLGAANLAGAELHVVAPGWTVLGDSPLTDGGIVSLQRDEALGATVGIADEIVSLSVVATDADGTAWTVSEMSFPTRFLRVLDTQSFDESGPKYAPWVAAVVPALTGIEGTPATHDDVVNALVKWVYEESGLEYDTRYGASAYTNYPRGNWETAQFDMGSFLDRHFGTVVNCSDCASIIVAYANMLGALQDYAIIGWDFDLDYIKAIGGDTYTRCPFGGGGCGFSYHAVTVDSAGSAVWDATLALDGDDDSEHTPNQELLVQTIESAEYLERLTSTPAQYAYQAQGTIQ